MGSNGIFVISLDFELYWGVRDKKDIREYKQNLDGTKKAIIDILKLFDKYKIHATWATVGFLFFNNETIRNNFPKKIPSYLNKNLNPYLYINQYDCLNEKYHFAPEIIKQIIGVEGQEIGTHTFSHYYCLEEGQTKKEFANDLEKVKEIHKKWNLNLTSLVFPRNQWKEDYLEILSNNKILAYRGNEEHWAYKVYTQDKLRLLRRLYKLLDTYFNLSGNNTYLLNEIYDKENNLFNIRASKFLRPYSYKLRFFEKLKIRRIKQSMLNAAKNNEVYHLWWHPHNFGKDLNKNLELLEEILKHYSFLNKKYNIRTLNMKEIVNLIKEKVIND